MSQIGQLPSIIMVPTNAVLANHLTALRTLKAQAASAGLDTPGSTGGGSMNRDEEGSSSGPDVPLEQLVDEFNGNSTVDSLMLLRRHCECSWLPWAPIRLAGAVGLSCQA
jgi:hypothetical protein